METNNQFGKKGWTPELMKSQKGKTFLITGTTSGTGFETAKIPKRYPKKRNRKNIHRTFTTVSH